MKIKFLIFMSTPNQKIEYLFSCAPTAEIAENNGSQTSLEPIRALLCWLQNQEAVISLHTSKTLSTNLEEFLSVNACEFILSQNPQLKQKLEEFLHLLKAAKDNAERESKDQVVVDNSKILPIVQELDKVIDEIE